MLPTGKTRRKLRPFFRYLITCIVLFFLTLFVVGAGIFFSLTHATILSPLSRALVKIPKQTVEQEVSAELASKNITLSQVNVSGNTITITLPNNVQIYMSTQKDLHEQIASLQLTIQNLTIEKKTPSKIDFRFDRPVISF